ncbi:MAG: hypothetical protein M1827_006167 [Pycnora praestabilis]|nr:MAG: hypothetical protein M1827_006167 [Pycnora praestabilis]
MREIRSIESQGYAQSKPERTPSSGSRMLNIFTSGSLSRKKKDGDRSTPRTPVDFLPSTPFTAELDAGAEAELPSSRPPPESDLLGAHHPKVDDTDINKVVADVEKNLERLAFLHKRSLSDPNTSQDTAVNHELDNLKSKTIRLCSYLRDCIEPLPTSPRKSILMTRGKAAVRRCIVEESDFRNSLQLQMEKHYQIIRPHTSDEEAKQAFTDSHAFRLTLSLFRNDQRHQVQSAIRTIEGRYQAIHSTDDRLSKLERILEDLGGYTVVGEGALHPYDMEKKKALQEFSIAPFGDVILEFGSPRGLRQEESSTRTSPWMQFRVSSQMLSVSSQLFGKALNPANYPRESSVTADWGLPDSPPIWLATKSAFMVYMPQQEWNDMNALTTLLHAAHLRNDATHVARKIKFREFVEIAKTCHTYQCTAPLDMVVECYWAPQWRDFVGQSGYEDWLYISYTFRINDIFEKTTKEVILSLQGATGLMDDTRLPKSVKDRIRAARLNKLSRLLKYCREEMYQYLPSLGSARRPSARRHARGLDVVRVDSAGSFTFANSTHCEQGDHRCDAMNLGWLIKSFVEIGVPIEPTNSYTHHFWQNSSLKFILSRLCGIPDPPSVHKQSRSRSLERQNRNSQPEGDNECNYAPGFRQHMLGVYENIKGITIDDINSLPDAQEDGITQSVEVMAVVSNSVVAPSQELDHAAPAINIDTPQLLADSARNVSRQASTHHSERTSSSWTEIPEESGVTALSDDGFQSNLNERNLARLENDNVSIISTEIDVCTDRGRCESPSPSVITINTTATGRDLPLRSGSGDIYSPRMHPTTTHNLRPIQLDAPDSRDDEKVFWARETDKAILPTTDKEISISHKNIIRIQDERRGSQIGIGAGEGSSPRQVDET